MPSTIADTTTSTTTSAIHKTSAVVATDQPKRSPKNENKTPKIIHFWTVPYKNFITKFPATNCPVSNCQFSFGARYNKLKSADAVILAPAFDNKGRYLPVLPIASS